MILFGIDLRTTVIFVDFPQNLCDHMPQKRLKNQVMLSKLATFPYIPLVGASVCFHSINIYNITKQGLESIRSSTFSGHK